MKALLLVLALAFSAGAEQFTDAVSKWPHRSVGAYKFDLSKSSKAWKHIRAKFVKPCPAVLGWVVVGTINGTNMTFVLKNPPRDVYARYAPLKIEFDRLTSEYKQSKESLNDATLAAAEAKANHIELLQTSPHVDTARERKREQAIAQAENERHQSGDSEYAASSRNDAIYEKLRAFDMQGFDLRQPFTFSVYAIKVQQSVEGLPVYDRGQILP